ncbi:hypothetical protein, partial [Mycobacterium avium]|uniref:hypothetical protein n=1 Tax=Mycobacterium avium TaxID=1764 RepID=UPI000AB21642
LRNWAGYSPRFDILERRFSAAVLTGTVDLDATANDRHYQRGRELLERPRSELFQWIVGCH